MTRIMTSLFKALKQFDATNEEGAVSGYWVVEPIARPTAYRVFRTFAAAEVLAAFSVLNAGEPCRVYLYKEVNGEEVKENESRVATEKRANEIIDTFGAFILDCNERIETAKNNLKFCGKCNSWLACFHTFKVLNEAMKVATLAVCSSLVEEVTERLESLRDDVTRLTNEDILGISNDQNKKGVDEDWDNFVYFTRYSDVL